MYAARNMVIVAQPMLVIRSANPNLESPRPDDNFSLQEFCGDGCQSNCKTSVFFKYKNHYVNITVTQAYNLLQLV